MWSKYQGDLTTFDFLVDGNPVGSFNNMRGDLSADLDDIREGRHSFTMSNIAVYRLMPTVYGPQVQPVATMECSGTFRVRDSSTLRIAATLLAAGEVQCSLH